MPCEREGVMGVGRGVDVKGAVGPARVSMSWASLEGVVDDDDDRRTSRTLCEGVVDM